MTPSLGARHRPVHLDSKRCFASFKRRKYFWVVGKPTRTLIRISPTDKMMKVTCVAALGDLRHCFSRRI